MDPAEKLSVIVPAYNKDSEVFQVVSSLVNELKILPYDWEIVVVDDASRDHTLREAVRSKKFNGNSHRIKIFSYNLNQGKGFALYYGFKQSTGTTIVFCDSDLDLPAKNIPVLLEAFQINHSDMAVGSKRHPLSQVQYPLTRKIMSKAYQILTCILFGLDVTDTQVGLKAFKRPVLEKCFPRIVVKKFAFDVELLVVAKHLGFGKILEVPVTLNYNFSSTITADSIKKILVDTLAIFYRKNLLKYYDSDHFHLEEDAAFISPQKAFI